MTSKSKQASDERVETRASETQRVARVEISAIEFYNLSVSDQDSLFVLARTRNVFLIDANNQAHQLIDLIDLELTEVEL